MFFKEIYEAVKGTYMGGSPNSVVQDYEQKRFAKVENELERAEFLKEEAEIRERMAELNKEYLEAERKRNQANSSTTYSDDEEPFEVYFSRENDH